MRPEDAVACMRAGASDYVFKDRPERLAVSIKRALGNVAERRARESAEQALRENEERLRLATEAAALEAWELDLAANRIHASARTRAELGMSDAAAPWSFDQWLLGIHPDDREMARRALIDTIRDGTPYHLEYRMTTSAGEIWVAVWGSLTHDASGRPQRLLGVWQNISARKAAEEEVLRSLQEKEALLREVHHRVNNNLQVIASLLRLEARRVVDPAVQESLGSMRNRIHAMAILHQTLYRSGRYAEVALGSYLQEVAGNVARSFATTAHAVEVKTSLSNVPLNVDQAIPCGLIVNELVTNSLKHGFPGGRVTEVVTRDPRRLDRCPRSRRSRHDWPEDGGPFVTLPLVYTEHPDGLGTTSACTACSVTTDDTPACTGRSARAAASTTPRREARGRPAGHGASSAARRR
jgi:PAS domain S-box-containing protein